MSVYLLTRSVTVVCVFNDYNYVGRTVSTQGLSILYVYVFTEYCLQLIMYSVSARGVVESIINVRYYYQFDDYDDDDDNLSYKT